MELEKFFTAMAFVQSLLSPDAEEEDEEDGDDEDAILELVAERDRALEELERAQVIIRDQNSRLQGAYEASKNLHQALHGLSTPAG